PAHGLDRRRQVLPLGQEDQPGRGRKLGGVGGQPDAAGSGRRGADGDLVRNLATQADHAGTAQPVDTRRRPEQGDRLPTGGEQSGEALAKRTGADDGERHAECYSANRSRMAWAMLSWLGTSAASRGGLYGIGVCAPLSRRTGASRSSKPRSATC